MKQVRDLSINLFSLSVDLTALRPDSAQALVVYPIASVEMPSRQSDPVAAARQVLQSLLEGNELSGKDGAWPFFRKLLAVWTIEVDLGALKRLEFDQIPDATFTALQKALHGTAKISGVWARGFDSRGLSTLDVETRLDATALKEAVMKAVGGEFVFDQGTRNFLLFKPAPKPAGEAAKPVVAGDGLQEKLAKVPAWAWGVLGAGVMALLIGVRRAGRGRA